jgi:hypothetical protein
MGMMKALAYGELESSLEIKLQLHFVGNCYPQIPLLMIPVAVDAINAYSDEDYFRMVELPSGVEFRNGEKEVSAAQIVESLRLDSFVMGDGYDYDEEL